MHRRVTPLPVVVFALLATASLASAAFACGGAGKSAAAMPSCCSAKVRTATACATPAAKTAAAPAACASPTALAAPAPAAAPFAALPSFAQPAPIVAGLMAFIDPETGMLTGPIGSLQVPEDLSRAFAAPVELTPVTLPAGRGVMIDLQGTLQDFYTITIDPLGRRAIRCVQDAKHAHAPVAPIAPVQPAIAPIAER